MPRRALWLVSALLAFSACSSEPSPYASTSGTPAPMPEPMKPEEPWHPVPMKDLVFVSRTAETFRPDGDPLKLSARVTAVIANRGDQSGSVALRLGLVLPDGTRIDETRVIDMGSRDEETVEAVFDLTHHEDRINGAPKYVHEILLRP